MGYRIITALVFTLLASVSFARQFDEPAPPVVTLPSAEAEIEKQDKALKSKLASQLDPAGQYIVAPLKGEFGKSINAIVLKEILRVARNNKCKHIIFELDSPGGDVQDAQAVGKMIESEWANFTFHVVIRRAFSASVWLASACDYIWLDPTGTSGAAVMFSVKSGVPSPVEAKVASAYVAEVVARAEAKKQPGCLYRAMMIQEAEAFGWESEGKYVVSSTRQGRSQIDVVDSESTVLALTPSNAQKYGFGRAIPNSGIAGIGEVLRIADWRTLKDPRSGNAAVIRGRRESSELDKAVDMQLAAIKSSNAAIGNCASMTLQQLSRARGSYPNPPVTTYDPRTGRPTGNALAMWQLAVDSVIQEWRRVQVCVNEVDSAETSFSNAVARANRAITKRHEMRKWEGSPDLVDPPMAKSGINKDAIWKEAESQIDTLMAQRNR